ncbi:MAG TPA: hypothetical protein VIK57_26340 [Streptosporangiaceae bacterium]
MVAVALIVAVGSWLLYVVWRSPHRSDLSTYGAFAVAVVALVAGWIAWAWQRARRSPAAQDRGGEDLDHVADLLAQAARRQWDLAAGERGLAGADPISVTWGRPTLPLAGPAAAAAGSQRFDPLPGLPPVGEAALAAGEIADLHAVYGGLRSGRLVIAGPPGSGKSGAAVLLILAALRYREQLPVADWPKVPVPVLFTAQDWDPRRQPVRDWLTARLQETYPLFTGSTGAANAAALIAAGKIAVILDGLDEITKELQPTALQALSQQASFRVVVLSRTAEMASAATHQGILRGAAAIELRPVESAEAARYLERVQLDPPPQGWHDLTERIQSRPSSPLGRALDSPLTLTLVRDTYQAGDDVRELLNFSDTLQSPSVDQAAGDITEHLLDRVLPAAYAHRLGQPAPRYDLQTAHDALIKIAVRMNEDGTRDLQWWRIPDWVPRTQRLLLAGLVFGLGAGLVFGLMVGLGRGPGLGLVIALGVGLGLASATAGMGGADTPSRIGRLRMRVTLEELVPGLGGGLLMGLGLGLLIGLRFGLVAGLVFGLVLGLVGVLVVVVVLGLAEGLADPDSTRSSSPFLSRRDDRKFGLVAGSVAGSVAGLVIGLVIGLVGGLVFGLGAGLGAGLVDGLVIALGIGLMVGLMYSRVWSSAVAAILLARQWHTPLHLMRFLEDARERNILRTVGPVYQFRHASLQDRLAPATSETAQSVGG